MKTTLKPADAVCYSAPYWIAKLAYYSYDQFTGGWRHIESVTITDIGKTRAEFRAKINNLESKGFRVEAITEIENNEQATRCGLPHDLTT